MPAMWTAQQVLTSGLITFPVDPALWRDTGRAGALRSRLGAPFGSARPDPVPSDSTPDDVTENGMQRKDCA